MSYSTATSLVSADGSARASFARQQFRNGKCDGCGKIGTSHLHLRRTDIVRKLCATCHAIHQREAAAARRDPLALRRLAEAKERIAAAKR